MQMHYATEVNGLHGGYYQMKEISQLTGCTRGKNCLSRVSLNLTAARRNEHMIIFTELQTGKNRPLPSSKNPLFQNEAKCKTFLVEMSFICVRMTNHFHIKG